MNILIIRFSSLGDIVMTTAVIEALRGSLPDARLILLTKEGYTGLFSADDRIERVIGIQGTESPMGVASLLPSKIDMVIDLHGTLRSRAVSALVRAKKVLRLRKHSIGRRIMVMSRGKMRRRYDVLSSYLDTVRTLGVHERVYPRLAIDRSARSEMMNRLGGEEARLMGFAPGARHDAKRWTESSYARLADFCAEKGFTPVFIGNGDDAPVIGRILDLMEYPAVSLAGSAGIKGTVAAVSLMRGLVTNDSGPMHIAGALEIPFAAVFGPTHPDLGFDPGYPSGRILHSGISCSPCSIHGEKECRLGERACMNNIPWELVRDSLFEIMFGPDDSDRMDSIG